MRPLLFLLFLAILTAMLTVTVWATLERSVFDAGYLFQERWFVATFVDAYAGFVTFYVWVAYKERGLAGRVAWFLGIMALGNIAMASYVLLQLWRLRPGDGWEQLLLRQTDEPA
jgi:hypothetical protein